MARPDAVKDYMSRIVVKFTPDMDVLQALHLLLEKEAPGGPVLDNLGNLIGILSEKDCLPAALSASYHEHWGGRVSEFMHTEVETVEASASIADVAKLFTQREYKHFPVMQENRLVGQISRRQILLALEQLRHEVG
ncbi:MAG: CBS domain-containing protein [Gammaproteobacteria bacterium]|nr:CBS domain-containing protein [Gammaproteobacteria bacterium]